MSETNETQPTPDTCSHECGSCSATCGERTAPSKLTPNAVSKIGKVIGIVSGKGGVGKTLVTCLIASELARAGKKVGIMDADVTGPSIPKAFGVSGPLHADQNGIFPAESKGGVKVISTNLLLPQGDMPVAWRGPVISGMVSQFFNEVNWGELDYLLIDMPPGTSDVLLTVFQQIPVDGIVTVSAPQELVAMIVGKAVNLAHNMDVEVLGLVENMAYFQCDECGKKHYIFGEPQGAEVAKKYDIPAYATLPIDPAFAASVDAGAIETYDAKGALAPIIEVL
ncbi:ATP-binding protein [Slackia equolifaciens]|uniref:Iron-sulfur cluster carrier protein n=1 Tax=Slackia equolifaciens TaxID=498718 RepID=A0A3N0ATY9_9ACTN|nr:Mrp/NBP35 family ATP-binding protein [Slackia equolifaciens]RNL38009.1 ATP-binding protein [Slackia equolifaciens]HJF64690.1 Mrp/NBP35 family ATP-binding protein [Slackia equolifaciens]